MISRCCSAGQASHSVTQGPICSARAVRRVRLSGRETRRYGGRSAPWPSGEPVPLLMLVASAVAAIVVPDLHAPLERTVEQILTVILICIPFDGGIHVGANRFRQAAGPIALAGIVGTFLTAAGGAVLVHYAFGRAWFLALLVATAIAPTDPAVVFSVLGQREIAGRSATVLEGANDPVGIALMSALIAAGSLSVGAFGSVAMQFVLQMVVGSTADGRTIAELGRAA